MNYRFKFTPVWLASAVVVVIVIWMASGSVSTSQTDREDIWQDPERQASRVQVEQLAASLYQPEVVVQGQVHPWQSVVVRAQVAGTVASLPVRLGQAVNKGDTLITLSDDARTEELAQARAALEQAEKDLEGASRLRGQNLASEQELLRLKSEVATARAAEARARRALSHNAPEAPFDGVFDHRHVELGDFVQPGEHLVQIVDVTQLKVSAQVPQQKVADLSEGQTVMIQLLNGRFLTGELTFIASAADPETRSFRVEAEVDNPDQLRIAGGSATLRIGLEPILATRISPAYLNLGDDGRLAIKHVDADDKVQLTPVKLLSADTDGAWIDGLPMETRIITQGAGFVHPGDQVEAIAPTTGTGE